MTQKTILKSYKIGSKKLNYLTFDDHDDHTNMQFRKCLNK